MPSTVLREQRWTRKPLSGVSVDWSHPLARNLIGCWLFFDNSLSSGLIDIAGHQTVNAITGTLNNAVTSEGTGLDCGSGGTNYYLVNRLFGPANNTDAMTLMARINPTTVASNMGIIHYGEVADTNWSSALNVTSAAHIYYAFGGIVTDALGITTVGTISANVWSTVGCSQASGGNTRSFIINGAFEADSTSIPPGDQGTSTSGLAIGTAFGNAIQHDPFQGKISWIYSWHRALSNQEMLQVYLDNYAFLKTVTTAPSVFRGSTIAPGDLSWISSYPSPKGPRIANVGY